MITLRRSSPRTSLRALRTAGTALLVAAAAGCSSLNTESARTLGAAGCDVTGSGGEAVFASRSEYQRALDAEAFFHGYAGAPVPERLLADYRTIQAELGARRLVFNQLSEVYALFLSLADARAADGLGAAVNRLGEAVNGYAAQINKAAAVTSADKDALARIGGLAGKRIQQRKLKAASALIRERLESFAGLLEDPLVRTQLTSFRRNLAASRSAAVKLLWEKGLLDPSPLISELGGDAGLKACKDAAKIIADPKSGFVQEALGAVVSSRLERRLDLVEQGYDASVRALRELAAQHRALENGGAASRARLHQLMTELALSTERLTTQAAQNE